MDKEAIEKRLTELRRMLEQVQANGNALIGAIQENERWLEQLEVENERMGRLTPAPNVQ